MKVILILIVSCISFSTCYSQSKKKQVEMLMMKVDSLQSILDSERASSLNTINSLNAQIKNLETDLVEADIKYDVSTTELQKEIDRLKRLNNTLKKQNNEEEIAEEKEMIVPIVEEAVIVVDKKEILSHTIGTYKLKTISGTVGTNEIFDTYKEEGRWKSTTSLLKDGERETTQIKLTNKDAQVLNEIHLEIDSKLNIKFLNGRTVIFEVPFNETGMELKITEGSENPFSSLTASTIMLDNQLILLANDSVNLSGQISGNFKVILNNRLIFKYSKADDAFYLDIFYGECCDSNTLVFKR